MWRSRTNSSEQTGNIGFPITSGNSDPAHEGGVDNAEVLCSNAHPANHVQNQAFFTCTPCRAYCTCGLRLCLYLFRELFRRALAVFGESVRFWGKSTQSTSSDPRNDEEGQKRAHKYETLEGVV